MTPLLMIVPALLGVGLAQAEELRAAEPTHVEQDYDVLVEDARNGLIRDLRGAHVPASEDGTIILFFSMADPESPHELAELSDLARRGHSVLAVNTDTAGERARIHPYLRRMGIHNVAAAHDPVRNLCDSVDAHTGDAVVVAHRDGTRVLWRGSEIDDLPAVAEGTLVAAVHTGL
jgi:hypothetical protein